ncbi:MAG: HNH endonuclease [archaeon]
MKKLFLLSFFLLFTICAVHAENLTCQYKSSEPYQEESIILRYVATGVLFGQGLTFSNFVDGHGSGANLDCTTSFKIINPNLQQLNLTVDYDRLVMQPSMPEERDHYSKNIILPGNSYADIQDATSNNTYCKTDPNSVSYAIIEPAGIVPVKLSITKYNEACLMCLGKVCLNDGDSCTRKQECGGGNCVRGVCNVFDICYNNDCKCASGEKQCPNNDKCVKKASLSIGSKPICSSEACTTNYINPSTGLCDKTPETLRLEEESRENAAKEAEANRTMNIEKAKQKTNTTIFVGIIATIVLIGGGAIIYRNKKLKEAIAKREAEEAEQARIIRQIELISKERDTKERELKDTKKGIDELKKKKKEIEKLRKDNEDQINKLLDWYKVEYGHEFILDNGYIRFAKDWLYPSQKGQFFHIWWFEKNIGRKVKPGYVIHHKNGKKLDNSISNLEEISIDDHNKIHGTSNV